MGNDKKVETDAPAKNPLRKGEDYSGPYPPLPDYRPPAQNPVPREPPPSSDPSGDL